ERSQCEEKPESWFHVAPLTEDRKGSLCLESESDATARTVARTHGTSAAGGLSDISVNAAVAAPAAQSTKSRAARGASGPDSSACRRAHLSCFGDARPTKREHPTPA